MPDAVEKHWPQVAALETALGRLASGTTIPVTLRPNASQVTVNREMMKHLRSQMYLEGL